MLEGSADTGLQAERTELAWRRTQVSLLVIACLALRSQDLAAALIAIASAGLLWLNQARRYQRSLTMLREERGRAQLRPVLGISLALLTIALLATFRAVHAADV